MKKAITFKRILKQLKADLIGKDSYRGVTLTYAWLANQFGHLALGFIPSFILYRFFCVTPIKAAIYVASFWFLFELYNFLGPLLSKKESKSEVVFMAKKSKYIFNPKWMNVAFDTFTDVCFFTLGSLLFSICIIKFTNTTILVVIAILAIYLILATKYWYVTKMYQFYARFPFQFRLSQWGFNIIPKDKIKVLNFLKLKPEETGHHLLIFGSLSTGKTSLGVGILNELSIKNNACLYVNAIKLYDYFVKEDNDILEAHEIWNWKSANFLMIDDINPSESVKKNLVSPKKFLNFIDEIKGDNTSNNREVLKNKNIIWIFGNHKKKKVDNEWVKMLEEIGVKKEMISTVNL